MVLHWYSSFQYFKIIFVLRIIWAQLFRKILSNMLQNTFNVIYLYLNNVKVYLLLIWKLIIVYVKM